MKKIKSVLFVDDDEITSYINKSIIEEMQIAEKVHCMEDEQKALEFIIEHCSGKGAGDDSCPELIFLDVHMPFFNALEFLELLQQHPGFDAEKLFIVLLTSSMHDRDKALSQKYKVQAYLNKPLTPEKISHILFQFFNRRGRI
ncbi:response regulator [Cesiribacter sp. SM1]|uniref:response regulator n=1 Tax=Cesiribacter sp. SM1 TaxID=2861196 RepID=UPI001CD5AB70|nr:response regulator [Cesiribacter sp. SM1]